MERISGSVYPVTNGEYFRFVAANVRWQRSHVPALFADADYLRHREGDLRLGARAPTQSPVTNVSWFAANAYCDAQGKRLPTRLPLPRPAAYYRLPPQHVIELGIQVEI